MAEMTAIYRLDPEVGVRVRALRKQKRLRQADVARLAGVAPNTVNGLESGRQTQRQTFEKIARALGTTAQALQHGDVAELSTVFRDLDVEVVKIARLYDAASQAIKSAVRRLLRADPHDLGERFARLDETAQADLLDVLDRIERRIETEGLPATVNGIEE